MNVQELVDIASSLVADDKGLLAMDESNPTCNRRFVRLGIPQTVEARRAYRELIITAPGLCESISGVILYDETIRQQKSDGTPFVKAIAAAGIIPGIKVDIGAKNMAAHPGEKITEGLDGLRDRLKEYFQMGARFAKWRTVITLGDCLPSWGCIEANAHALARYAALCQEAGIIPVVEPEVLMDGEHTLRRCGEVTEEVLRAVFDQLYTQRVMLEGMILKPNMVLPGLTCPKQESVDEVADATVSCLLRTVPAAVPGIAFLSGGQSAVLASARLNAMNVRFKSRLPWALAFSYARAIQQPALETWQGKEAHVSLAQHALVHRARCNRAAPRRIQPRNGKDNEGMKINSTDFRVRSGKQIILKEWPTIVKPFCKSKKRYKKLLEEHVEELSSLQCLHYASSRYALLLIFQGMDAAGKDGAVRHVMSGVNPEGCEVFSFKQPSAEELKHDFLWRTTCRLPERGRIGIFNRSYYEEVLVVRVHPEILRGQGLPHELVDEKDLWKERYRSIVDLEEHLYRNGTRIIKIFLHLSKDEQRKRFLERIDEPDKNWKFSLADIHERKYWKDYMQVYGDCLSATSTRQAPWYIVPADDKENARLIVSQIVLDALNDLKMAYPKTTAERRRELKSIRKQL